jgi:IclR family mhp operon transcriptional activator
MRARGMVEQLIRTTQRNKFAERAREAIPEASSSVAVPIYEYNGRNVLATIGLTYYTSAVRREEILERYVPHLKAASIGISENVARMTSTLEADRKSAGWR